jgi:hypothetical protein
MQASLKLASGENGMPLFSRQTLPRTGFSAEGCREAFYSLGIQDVIEFDSSWCSFFCLSKKKKEETGKGRFFPGQTLPVGCATLGFLWLLGAVEFYVQLMCRQLLFWLEAIKIA